MRELIELDLQILHLLHRGLGLAVPPLGFGFELGGFELGHAIHHCLERAAPDEHGAVKGAWEHLLLEEEVRVHVCSLADGVGRFQAGLFQCEPF